VNVQFKDSFVKDLRKVKDKAALKRVKEVIEQAEQARSLQDVTNLKKLKGGRNYYRIRVGEFRIGLIIEGDEIMLVRCLSRKEIYRYFP